jgi:primosomal protein N' (replication factor Y)
MRSLFPTGEKFIEVAVPLPLDKPFTYRVPPGQEARARVGVRALVPFGRQKLTGLVTAVADESALVGHAAKDVLSFLDDEPYITERHLDFLSRAARECLAPLGEMLRTALPRGLARHDAPAAPRTETFYRLAPDAGGAASTPKQRLVADALREAGELSASALSAKVAGGAEAAKRMLARGLVTAETREKVVGLSDVHLPDLAGDLEPTPAQAAALETIGASIRAGDGATFVLHGITGSGKTEVYLRAIAEARARGKQSIFLVPEIVLTPQLLGRVRARFGDGVAVLHSQLTPAERTAQWRRVRSGEVFLCVGARSAVFSPFPALGLVVVDEEHDAAYKQEDGIRYQARDLALLRGSIEGATVLLGSATPSAEAVRMTRTGRATLLDLPERIGDSLLPDIKIVDLRDRADRRGADRYFSTELEAAVDETLARGEKAMLFLNRRGFAPVLSCLDCAATVQCPDCQVSMAYHKEYDALLCHYCHRRQQEPESCPSCGGHKLAQLGLGTERLAAWAAKRWPDARVGRLDSDVGRTKGAASELLGRMHRGEVDILVGTQMIAKGHDFPEVTFVGVLYADASLRFIDFRASERTFQVLTQVAGRAGRGDRPGTVLIQTLSPENACLRKIAEHDFFGFMDEELATREALEYPPFGRMMLLRLWGPKEERVRDASALVASALSESLAAHAVRLLGPAPSPIAKVKKLFRFQILLKMPADFPVADVFPELLRPLRDAVRRHGVRMEADVDPYHMLV